MATLQSAFGLFALLAICWLISENRRAVSWWRVGASLMLTLVLAVMLLKIPALNQVFATVSDAVNAIAAATRAGTSFVFGYLGGAPLPFEPRFPGSEFVLAFQALPVVLVVSVPTTLLYEIPASLPGTDRLPRTRAPRRRLKLPLTVTLPLMVTLPPCDPSPKRVTLLPEKSRSP